MKKETLLIGIVALLAGLIVGYMLWQKKAQPAPAVTPPPVAGNVPMAAAGQQIDKIKAIVASDPKNRQAWISLGNEYFDADRPMESVEAYQKALDLDANDPNVLTDQGVMFRRLGWYDRAVANFTRATQIDPRHANSLFNLGVIYRYDLKDYAKATEAWNKFLAVNPNGPGADRARQELEYLKIHSANKQP